jgi:hypothetical protein
MDSAFSRLSKVISLERKQATGTGGDRRLDKFARRWEPDAVRCAAEPSCSGIVSLLIGYRP